MNIISNGSSLRPLPKNRDILKKTEILRVFYRVSLGTLTNRGAMDKFPSRKKKESFPYKETILTGLQT